MALKFRDHEEAIFFLNIRMEGQLWYQFIKEKLSARAYWQEFCVTQNSK